MPDNQSNNHMAETKRRLPGRRSTGPNDGTVGLVAWGSGLWAQVAAESTGAVAAVAAYDPGANEVMNEQVGTRLQEAFARVGQLAAEGRLLDAAQALIDNSDGIYNEEELASGAPAAFWEAAAPNLPVFLREEQLAGESSQPGPTDPSVLARITVPVLLLHGSESRPWFADSVRHVADHVADPHVREIPGAGHFGPHTEPEAVAEELIAFFTGALTAT